MLGRPRVALRGSFRPRLASTTGEDPRATTDPDEGPSEYRHAPDAANARAAVSRWTCVHAGAHEGLGARGRGGAGRQHVVDQDGRGAGHGRTPAERLERAAHRHPPLRAGRRACGAVATARRSSRRTGRSQPAADGAGERPRLVVAALGEPPSCERHPGDRVGGRRIDRDHGVGERGRDAPPSRELQPVDRAPRRSRVQERRPGDARPATAGSRAALDRARRAPAPLAPRRRERLERAHGTRPQNGHGPAPHPAHRGGNTTSSAASDHERDASRRPPTRPSGLGQNELDRAWGRPRMSIVSVDCVRMTG